MFIVIASNSNIKERATINAIKGTSLEDADYTSCDSYFETSVEIGTEEDLLGASRSRAYTGLTCHPTDIAIGTEGSLIKKSSNKYVFCSCSYIVEFGSEVAAKSNEYVLNINADELSKSNTDEIVNSALEKEGFPALGKVYEESIKNAVDKYLKLKG